MNKVTITMLYDVLVYITNHYSDMPLDFRVRFSESACGILRQNLFDNLDNK